MYAMFLNAKMAVNIQKSKEQKDSPRKKNCTRMKNVHNSHWISID